MHSGVTRKMEKGSLHAKDTAVYVPGAANLTVIPETGERKRKSSLSSLPSLPLIIVAVKRRKGERDHTKLLCKCEVAPTLSLARRLPHGAALRLQQQQQSV